jgi:hypothetical protein
MAVSSLGFIFASYIPRLAVKEDISPEIPGVTSKQTKKHQKRSIKPVLFSQDVRRMAA